MSEDADDNEMVPVSRAFLKSLVVQRETKKDRWVYFLHAFESDLMKIGVADIPEKRLRGIAMQSPEALNLAGLIRCSNYGKLEKVLHKEFEHLRAHGEWFSTSYEMWEFIDTEATGHIDTMVELQEILRAPRKRQGRQPSNGLTPTEAYNRKRRLRSEMRAEIAERYRERLFAHHREIELRDCGYSPEGGASPQIPPTDSRSEG